MRLKELCLLAGRFLVAFVVGLALTSSSWAAHEKILHNFVNLPRGASPQANVIADAAGNLYGTAYTGGQHEFGAVFELSKGAGGAWTENVLYSFLGGADGYAPTGGLIWDSTGSLYGTTTSGGNGCNPNVCGVVFKLTPSARGRWSETVLYSFRGYSNGDGSSPYAALVFDSAGNLYGTTAYDGGGSNGMVFKLTPTSGGGWTESILYAFTGNADGSTPTAALTFDSAGNLYSTTLFGGDVSCGGVIGPPGCGTVFELTPQKNGTWKENTLYSFQDNPAFLNLSTSVAIDSRGNLYGTTSAGEFFFGSVFRLTPDTKGNWNYKTLYAFAGGSDGYAPLAGLLLNAGKLYGTTEYGGVISGKTPCPYQIGCGTIFELAPASGGGWTERVLHKFSGGADGAQPFASLISDQAGNLYATASAGGGGGCDYTQVGCGAVFKLLRGTGGKWTGHVLYKFAASDGYYPLSTLIADSSGNLYGTTNAGGKGGDASRTPADRIAHLDAARYSN